MCLRECRSIEQWRYELLTGQSPHQITPKTRQIQAVLLLYLVSHTQVATLSLSLIPLTLTAPIPSPCLSTNQSHNHYGHRITSFTAPPNSLRPLSRRPLESRSDADITPLPCPVQLQSRHLRPKQQDSWHSELLSFRLYLPCRLCGILAYAYITPTYDPEL